MGTAILDVINGGSARDVVDITDIRRLASLASDLALNEEEIDVADLGEIIMRVMDHSYRDHGLETGDVIVGCLLGLSRYCMSKGVPARDVLKIWAALGAVNELEGL